MPASVGRAGEELDIKCLRYNEIISTLADWAGEWLLHFALITLDLELKEPMYQAQPCPLFSCPHVYADSCSDSCLGSCCRERGAGGEDVSGADTHTRTMLAKDNSI
jgi:hypothetical protein